MNRKLNRIKVIFLKNTCATSHFSKIADFYKNCRLIPEKVIISDKGVDF